MAGVTLYGRAATASVSKEILIGSVLGLAAGLGWKCWHWNDRKEVEQFYSKLAKASK